MSKFVSQLLETLPQQPLSVAEAIELLNQVVKPLRLTIRGEVTQFTNRGHAYFTFSDPHTQAHLNCIAWQSTVRRWSFDLQEGQELELTGSFNVYAPNGRLSFIVERARPLGEGALKEAFERLKAELQTAGYFDVSRKRDLPQYPKVIGLITSLHGDAITDFQTHLAPVGITIQHRDARVEGTQAVDSLVAALQAFNRQPGECELVVITRGGGSLESLQAFNSRELAEAIATSRLPVLSAVGHENDVTIADLVADVRASTPTDAGKVLSEQWRTAPLLLKKFHGRLELVAEHIAHTFESKLNRVAQIITASVQQKVSTIEQLLRFWPQRTLGRIENQLQSHHEELYRYGRHWPQLLQQWWQHTEQSLAFSEKLLQQNDPQLKLKQGYSLTKDHQGQLVRSVTQLQIGATLKTVVSDGAIDSTISHTQLNESKS